MGGVTIFGWSLGGFLAAEFAARYHGYVDGIFLAGIRKKYCEGDLENICQFIKRDKKAYLYKFYNECFSAGEEGFAWFKKNLMKAYLEEMGLNYLLEGIYYLSQCELDLKDISDMNITLIHGEEDKIAPYKEVLEIKKSFPYVNLISLKGTGHIPFLNATFKDCMKPCI